MTHPGAMSFTKLVVFLHEQLETTAIDHAFGGGLALGYHVRHPRATDDIDLNISVGAAGVQEVFRSLPAGIKWDSRSIRIAEIQGAVKLRWVRGIPVDLFFATNEYHQLVLDRAELYEFDGVPMKFVTATDLTVLKATFDRGGDITGKERDWLDIRSMLDAGTVDVDEATRWLERIPGAAEFLTRFSRLAEEVGSLDASGDLGVPDVYRSPPPSPRFGL